MKRYFILTLIVLLVIPCIGQEVNEKAIEKEEVKTWTIPPYMIENLQAMIDEFNKVFAEKLEFYKKELKYKYKGYEDMPIEVIFNGKDSFVLRIPDKIKTPGEGNEKK